MGLWLNRYQQTQLSFTVTLGYLFISFELYVMLKDFIDFLSTSFQMYFLIFQGYRQLGRDHSSVDSSTTFRVPRQSQMFAGSVLTLGL